MKLRVVLRRPKEKVFTNLSICARNNLQFKSGPSVNMRTIEKKKKYMHITRTVILKPINVDVN